MKKETDNKNEEMSFEEALAKLGETVRLLEEGKAPLEESMKYYEEGVKLVRFCSEKLKNARQKITEVGADGND